MPLPRLQLVLLVSIAGVMAAPALAQSPLAERIDGLILAKARGHSVAPVSDDGTFVRRAYLDFAGRIPTVDEVRKFLADASADKRTRLIDQLLASPEHVRRLSELLHVVLMERRGEHEEWSKYLRASVAVNKPWDQLVRELLYPDANDETRRGAGFFLTKRLENYGQNPVDYPGLTRDVGRLFLGRDLQCAQCHNHLFIDEYKQIDFQGLYAVFLNTSIRTDVKFPAVKEKPFEKKLEFVSVFDPTRHETGPRIPGGKELDVPSRGKDASTLALLAEELTRPTNRDFARNIANRLWWAMMGRGIVHPLDLHHGGNAPSHPELLELLADELIAHQFDMRWMLRELALTQTYQRAGTVTGGESPPPASSFLVFNEKRLSAEQLLLSVLYATGESRRAPGADGTPAADNSTPTFKELQAAFVGAFANQPREPEEEVAVSVKGALFLMNDDKFLSLLQAREGNRVERLSRIDDSAALAEELYLGVLSRPPAAEESALVAGYLAQNKSRRQAAVSHLVWALLSSHEFYVNH